MAPAFGTGRERTSEGLGGQYLKKNNFFAKKGFQITELQHYGTIPGMNDQQIKRRRGELSKQQAIYVAKRETGASREQSAIFAGYPPGQKAGDQVEQYPTVQKELAKARQELASASGITREDVLQGMKEAAEMAKTMADPQAMVRAWSELGKLLGFYAPEVKKVLHGLDTEQMREALRALPDHELQKLAHGRIIEGESKRVEPPEDV